MAGESIRMACCGNCLYCQKQVSSNGAEGRCQKAPPGASVTGSFPWVSTDDWCGEFKPLDADVIPGTITYSPWNENQHYMGQHAWVRPDYMPKEETSGK